MKNFVKSESGQTLVLMAMCLTTLVGFLGLATDVGLLYHDRQEQQTAADSAAIATAVGYLNGETSPSTSGQNAATANGYTNGSGTTVVSINVGPNFVVSSDPDNVAGYVEAIVTKSNPLSFLQIFGNTSASVSARAVAGYQVPGQACITLLAASGVGMHVQGAYDIETPNCGIVVDSSSNNAIDVTGNGGTVNAAYLDAFGDTSPKHDTSPTPITAGVAPQGNPFCNSTYTACPTTPATCSNSAASQAATSITAANLASVVGTPADGSAVCFTNAVTVTNVTLPGGASGGSGVVYVFNAGVTVSGTVAFGTGTCSSGTCSTTNGAVMDLAGGSLGTNNYTLSLYGPTSGTYDAVAIMQPAANTTELQVQFGSSNETLDGYIYAPGAEVYLQDNGGGVSASGIVADSLFDKSSTLTINNYNSFNSSTTPFHQATLVE